MSDQLDLYGKLLETCSPEEAARRIAVARAELAEMTRPKLEWHAWLCVDLPRASFALAFVGDWITGGAPYGMKIIGKERNLARVCEKFERMRARLTVLPAPRAPA